MYKSLFAGICLFALAACGSGTDQNVDGGTDPDPDAGPVNQLYTRNAGLDVGPYQAYTYQKDPLDRHFTALQNTETRPKMVIMAGYLVAPMPVRLAGLLR